MGKMKSWVVTWQKLSQRYKAQDDFGGQGIPAVAVVQMDHQGRSGDWGWGKKSSGGQINPRAGIPMSFGKPFLHPKKEPSCGPLPKGKPSSTLVERLLFFSDPVPTCWNLEVQEAGRRGKRSVDTAQPHSRSRLVLWNGPEAEASIKFVSRVSWDHFIRRLFQLLKPTENLHYLSETPSRSEKRARKRQVGSDWRKNKACSWLNLSKVSCSKSWLLSLGHRWKHSGWAANMHCIALLGCLHSSGFEGLCFNSRAPLLCW